MTDTPQSSHTEPTPFPTNGSREPLLDPDVPSRDERKLPSRAEVQAIRALEVRGVPFKLDRTGGEAIVRAFSMADQVILSGMPDSLQQKWVDALNEQRRMADLKTRTTGDQRKLAASDEKMANVACVHGFVRPRLVLTEQELDGSDECWLVTDLHLDERRRYLRFVTGNPDQEDLKLALAFRDSTLALTANR